jgi:hypothetical protein
MYHDSQTASLVLSPLVLRLCSTRDGSLLLLDGSHASSSADPAHPANEPFVMKPVSRDTQNRPYFWPYSPECVEGLFCELRVDGQPVEKVGVGPVCGPREPENKSKTLQKRRIRPPNREQKSARRSFSTGCGVPTASLSPDVLDGRVFRCVLPRSAGGFVTFWLLKRRVERCLARRSAQVML